MIIGIDGSLSSTGWSIHDGNTIIALGKICTVKTIKNNHTLEQEEEDLRIANICDELIKICKEHNVTYAKMEGQFIGAIASKKTGMQLSRLRGAMMMALRLNNIGVQYKQPAEVKKSITGKGNATKEIVAEKVMELYKNNNLVSALGPFIDRSCKAKNSDIYDSIAIVTAD